jgi:hypothetical protein
MSLLVKPACVTEIPAPATGLRVVPACADTEFGNTEQTFNAECPEGNTGDPVAVTIPAGSYSAATQEEADALALAAATEQAQAALECTSDICGDSAQAVEDLVWTPETGGQGSTDMVGGEGTFTFTTVGSSGGYDTATTLCNPCDAPYDITVTIEADGGGIGPTGILPVMSFTLFIDGAPADSGSLGGVNDNSASGTLVLTGTIPAQTVVALVLDMGLMRFNGTMSGTITITPLTPPCL